MLFNRYHSKTHVFLGLFLLLLGLAVGIWWKLDWAMQLGLQQLLQQTSASTPIVSGARFSLDSAEFSKLKLDLETAAGPLALNLEGIKTSYEIKLKKLHALSIANAQIKFAFQPVAQTSSDTLSAKPVLPLQHLTIDHLDLQIDSPWGEVKFVGRAELNISDASVIQLSLQDAAQSIKLEIGPDWRQTKLLVQQKTGQRIFELTYQQAEGIKHQAHLQADADQLVGWLSNNNLIPTHFRGQLAPSVLVKESFNHAGMKLQLEASSQDNLATMQGRLMLTHENVYWASAEWTLKTQNMLLGLDGHLDLPAAEFMVLIKPWLPESTQSWHPTQGTVLGDIDLNWQAQSILTGSVHLKSRNVDLAIGSIQASDSSIQLDIQDLAKSPLALKIEVPKLTIGKDAKLHNLQINAQYQQNHVNLKQATLPIFGGVLAILPENFSIDQFPVQLTLVVQNLDLSQLIDSLNIPNLSGTGSLSGKLPLRLGAKTIEVNDGVLNSIKPGVLRYQTPVTDAENIAFSALRNLQYHSLQAKINYQPNGDYQIGLRLEGQNQQVLSGHPLAFNLNLHGQLPELLQKGILAGNFEQPILEQLNGGHKH